MTYIDSIQNSLVHHIRAEERGAQIQQKGKGTV